MIEQVIEAIDTWVQEIYTPDQDKISEKYIAFLDAISSFLTGMAQQGYQVNIDEDLQKLQGLVQKKDYVALADFLLYEIKVDFLQLKETLKGI